MTIGMVQLIWWLLPLVIVPVALWRSVEWYEDIPEYHQDMKRGCLQRCWMLLGVNIFMVATYIAVTPDMVRMAATV